MNSFLYSFSTLSDDIQKTLCDANNLNPNGFHVAIFDTNKAETNEELEEYIKNNGLKDIKIRILADCYPIASYSDEITFMS